VRRVKEQFALSESKKTQKSKPLLTHLISIDEILDVLKKYKQENQIVKKDEKKIGFDF